MSLAICASTNAIWAPTGYGQQIAQLAPRMQADGHAVAIAANYGLAAQGVVANGIYHYPMGLNPYSDDVLSAHAADWFARNAEHRPLVFTLFDVWPLTHPSLDTLPIMSWVPVDHVPLPPRVAAFLRKDNVRPVAMSRFGERMMQDAGIDCDYVPHAIDTTVFAPRETVIHGGNELTGRQAAGVPNDAWLIVSADANKGWPARKAWGERALAVAQFMRTHEDAWWYIHCDPTPSMGGPDLGMLFTAAGVDMSRVRFPNQYALRMGIPPEALAAIFTSANVLLACSYGEGFGITVVEAQGTGLPVVVSDFTAQPELVGEGWIVEVQRWWDAPQGAWWGIPDVGSMVDALNEAFRVGKVGKARQFVLDNYDADTVYRDQWKPVLAAAEGRAA